MQKVWAAHIKWTDQLPDDLFVEWQQWLQVLLDSGEATVPRCYHSMLRSPSSSAQLHIFTDASAQAYSAVAYWRIKTPQGVDVSFIIGKCRCVPQVAPTIPKLELQAAVLGAQVAQMVLAAHTVVPARPGANGTSERPAISYPSLSVWQCSLLLWLRK